MAQLIIAQLKEIKQHRCVYFNIQLHGIKKS